MCHPNRKWTLYYETCTVLVLFSRLLLHQAHIDKLIYISLSNLFAGLRSEYGESHLLFSNLLFFLELFGLGWLDINIEFAVVFLTDFVGRPNFLVVATYPVLHVCDILLWICQHIRWLYFRSTSIFRMHSNWHCYLYLHLDWSLHQFYCALSILLILRILKLSSSDAPQCLLELICCLLVIRSYFYVYIYIFKCGYNIHNIHKFIGEHKDGNDVYKLHR